MSRRRPKPQLLPAALLAAAALYAAFLLRQALLPFLLAFSVAYVVNPVIDAVEARGARRFHVVLGFYLLAAAAAFVLAQYLLPLAAAEASHLRSLTPAYFAKAQQLAADLHVGAARRLARSGLPFEKLSAQALASAAEQLRLLPSYLLGLFPLISLLFLVPFITFFLLLDGRQLVAALIQACPGRFVEAALHLLSEIDAALGNYLRGIVIVALAIAAASYAGLLLLGVNGALAIALLAGASSFVPYLGAIVGALVGGGAAFVQTGHVGAGLQVVALFAGIRLADEALLQPVIARRSVHLHPLVFLLALMAGGEAFGFVGLLFAVPAACVVKSLLKVGWEWYLSEARLGAGPAGRPAAPYT
ncbi:MAG: AI-2E family transporter [Elusimicrobia bacterium]|nr:AI-2E family transporter [Elusimicrobiota bacterium]